MTLVKGQLYSIKNEFNSKIEGYFYDKKGSALQIVSSKDGSIIQWNEYKTDVITELEGKKSAKELELSFASAQIKQLTWQGHSLGSDPEFFLVDGKTNEVIPAFDFLPTQKDSHGSPFWDGFQAEFNISSGSCLDQRVASMQHMIRSLYDRALAHNKRARYTIDSTIEVPAEIFNRASPKHIEFGCSPSKNVYGTKGIELNGSETRIRNAGGHLHFGLSDSQKKQIPQYVKNLDRILGVACVSLFQNYDNPMRRQFYGLAGEHRTPSHGLEYRTLTNAWACHPRMMYIVFELARKCIALEQVGLSHLWDATDEEVQECINNCDVTMAKQILLINEEVFKSILHSMCYQREDTVNVVYNTIMQGMEVLIPNPENIIENWTKSVYDSRISNISSENHPYLRRTIKY